MGKQRVLWRLGNKHFSSISESTVHIWEGLKQDLSGKRRTVKVGVFKMHAHAHTFDQLTIILLQIALGVNTPAADANQENCMFDIDLWCLCPWWGIVHSEAPFEKCKNPGVGQEHNWPCQKSNTKGQSIM